MIHLLREIIDVGIGIFGLFVFVLLAFVGEIGFQIGRVRGRAAASLDKETAGVSTLTTGMLGFVAFTLALTIGIAENRFEARRLATLNEANAIGTAWLRVGLAGAAGKPIAGLIEEYARVRLAYLEATSPDKATEPLAHTNTLQSEIWQRTLPVLEACQRPWPRHSCRRLTTCSTTVLYSIIRWRAGCRSRRCWGCCSVRCSPP